MFRKSLFTKLEKINTVNGSITLEAAIALPLFILLMTTFIFIGKIIYIESKVSMAMIDALEKVNQIIIVADSFEYVDPFLQSYDATSHNNQKIIDEVNQTIEQVSETKNHAIQLSEMFSDEIGQITAGDQNNPLEINGIIEIRNQWEQLLDQIKNTTQSLIDQGYEIGNIIDQVKSNPEVFKQLAQTQIVQIVETQVFNSIIKASIENQLKQDPLIHKSMPENFTFKGSNYLFNRNDLSLVVTYDIPLPFHFGTIKSVRMCQKKCLKAYIGDNGRGYGEKAVAVETTTGSSIVYITASQLKPYMINGVDVKEKIYHTDANCSYLNVNKKEKEYDASMVSMPFCKICSKNCKSEEWIGKPVWVTEYGSVIHSNENCSTLKREVLEMTLEEALALGARCCKKCEDKHD